MTTGTGGSEPLLVPEDLSAGFHFLRDRAGAKPVDTAVIFGSGLGETAGALLPDPLVIRYSEIPGMPDAHAVGGHAGELHIGEIGTHRVAFFLGRFHLYQGLTAREVVHPVRLAAALGAQELLLTNAAGSIDPDLEPGQLMLIADHINLTGQTPLDGVDPIHHGSPFVSMSNAYSARLRTEAHWAAHHTEIDIVEGVYVGLHGPQYETPAEVAYLNGIGGHAVGMSTVLETIAARALSLKVLGLSLITNRAGAKSSHQEVLAAAAAAREALAALLGTYLHREELHAGSQAV